MTFTVTWSTSALDRLAELWLAATDRNSIADACDQIDKLLRLSADKVGRSRTNQRKRLIVGSLGVDFEVNIADRRVKVLTLWVVTDRY